ncbi:MAG: ABC transporter ATP-binding protein [Microbacteriaceae bacterium]
MAEITQDRTPILEVQDLNVEFWVEGVWYPAAKDLNYTLKRGESLAIVGESGSGKSASSMALLGLLPANARYHGSVKLEGEEIMGTSMGRLREIRGEKIAVIFQEPMTALNPVYTIGFQIVETIRNHRSVTKAAAKRRAIELLEMVEMPDPQKAFDSYPHQLSGGQRQRAMIAQSISCDPDILIADEPTTALDVTVQAEILELMRNLRDKLDSGVILITHDMGVVADLADNVMVMRNGEVVETNTVHEIFKNPQHEYTKTLLSSVPHLGVGEASDASDAVDRTVAPAISIKDLVIEYPKRGRVPAFRAVDSINLEIFPGEVVGLVGESGSGKTTVGRAIVGLLPVHSGQLIVGGEDMSTVDAKHLLALRRRLGIVFQDPGSSLNPRWPVGQCIAEPLELAKYGTKAEINARVEELLAQVELPQSYRNRFPHELSGGQRQRIGIARALALSPDLLVADEPTSALDVSVQARVLELLLEIQNELNFACLFISHDLAVVDQLCDRIAVMHHGKIVEQNTTEQILRNPQDPYTKKLLAAVPLPDPDAQRDRRELRKHSKD